MSKTLIQATIPSRSLVINKTSRARSTFNHHHSFPLTHRKNTRDIVGVRVFINHEQAKSVPPKFSMFTLESRLGRSHFWRSFCWLFGLFYEGPDLWWVGCSFFVVHMYRNLYSMVESELMEKWSTHFFSAVGSLMGLPNDPVVPRIGVALGRVAVFGDFPKERQSEEKVAKRGNIKK